MSIENMKRAANRLAKSREKGATTVALYDNTGFNVADMPIELFDALPALLATAEALTRYGELEGAFSCDYAEGEPDVCPGRR